VTAADVAIIGGGCSGTLQALQLLRRGARVALVERGETVARGVAYGTARPEHLLNVPVARMSAFPDAPDHFAEWMAERGLGAPADFAPRSVYGDYLQFLLAEAQSEAGDRLRLVRDEAVDVEEERIFLTGGGELVARHVILAPGNLAPSRPPYIPPELLASGAAMTDPWTGDISRDLDNADTVLLIGTGLTAIDAALTLDAAGFRGRVLGLSRRGLAPRAHAAGHHGSPHSEPPPERGSQLVRRVRTEAAQLGWRAAVDALRPVTQRLWKRADVAERRRFLRHLRPWWDVHRHRIAPSIAQQVDRLVEEGRLTFAAGKILSVEATGRGALVTWRPRGEDAARSLDVARIVNCTGPEVEIGRAGDPLLNRLLATGRIRPDACRIGIDVDEVWRVRGGDGRASETLSAIGPFTRSAVWEIVAVPDIRVQVQQLAARLA
jgi:uncharacterized NAD(P)/FAD-binding protein YdhS